MISIIIPAYKAEKYIEETIRSVIQQTIMDWELIVVDDGSPDNLGEVVKKLQLEDSRIQYVRQKNAGVSTARNYGYNLSKGDYIAFLDADDVWLPNNLSLKLEKFAIDKTLGLVHSDTEVIDSFSKRIGEIKQGKEGYILEDLLLWNGTCIPAPSSILVKREVLEKVGGFDKELSTAADQEFFFRVAAQYKIGRVSEVTWFYRVHGNNMSSNVLLMEKDELLTYKKAKKNKLFKSTFFCKKCFSNMYLILAGSWWKNGNNKIKGSYYIIRSILVYPPQIINIFQKFLR
jgi:glycosyltransferase involved in cell wall biosynthesis